MGVDGEAMGYLLTWIFLDGLTIYRNLETYGTFLESVDRTLIHEMSVRACNSELGEVAECRQELSKVLSNAQRRKIGVEFTIKAILRICTSTRVGGISVSFSTECQAIFGTPSGIGT